MTSNLKLKNPLRRQQKNNSKVIFKFAVDVTKNHYKQLQQILDQKKDSVKQDDTLFTSHDNLHHYNKQDEQYNIDKEYITKLQYIKDYYQSKKRNILQLPGQNQDTIFKEHTKLAKQAQQFFVKNQYPQHNISLLNSTMRTLHKVDCSMKQKSKLQLMLKTKEETEIESSIDSKLMLFPEPILVKDVLLSIETEQKSITK